MKQKLLTLAIVVFIAGMMSLVVIISNNKDKQIAEQKVETLKQSEPIFYYGNTCPHCKDVEEWFKANQVEEKIQFTQKEVYDDMQNANELNQVAASCGMDTSSIGVPFLYAEGKCLVGSPDIIKYFSDKLGIDNTQEATQASNRTEGTPSATIN